MAITDKTPASVSCDALVVAVQPDGDGATLTPGHRLPAAVATHLDGVLAALGATGKVDDVHSVALVPDVKAKRVVLTGVAPTAGTDKTVTANSIRQGVGSALRTLGKAETVLVVVPDGEASWVGAAAEGAQLGSYGFTAHKSAKDAKKADGPRVGSVQLAVSDAKDKDTKAAVKRAEILSSATAYVRDLVNSPPNVLYPQSFVDSVKKEIADTKTKIEVVVHDEKKLAALGCGGIIGVGQGSARPPRIMELHYRPSRKPAATVALVGKGITFDTGGLCIKPASGMLTMKCDMAGAGAVAGAVLAAAQLKLPVAVSGYLCLAENMPGGGAQRPSDIVSMRNGLTVEIIDTDAEGRMVLGDGLALAGEADPDVILDVATLTGACMIALGTRVAGVMSNDDATAAGVLEAAADAGEPMWHLPLPEELRAKLDSGVADLQHKGDSYGGALTAGLFLREFAKDKDGSAINWAHLDIAGPAFLTDAPYGYLGKGGTGYGVATLVAFAEKQGAK